MLVSMWITQLSSICIILQNKHFIGLGIAVKLNYYNFCSLLCLVQFFPVISALHSYFIAHIACKLTASISIASLDS